MWCLDTLQFFAIEGLNVAPNNSFIGVGYERRIRHAKVMKNGKIPIDDKGNPIFKADKNLPDIGQENGFLFIFKSNRNTSTPLNF